MKRFFLIVLIIIAALIILPPLYFMVFPVTPPELPEHGKQIEIRPGVSINYTDEGEGPPVILVHGLPGSAYDWRETSALLAKQGFRAIAYDRVGYGRSSARDSSSFTVRGNTDDLNDFITALGFEKVTIVGWSYGGVIAMMATALFPEKLNEIILVGTGGPQSESDTRPEAPFIMKVLYSEPVLRWRSSVP
ncbi:MAG: alpha/beta hydrolase, partial [Pseudomonadota bacterium]